MKTKIRTFAGIVVLGFIGFININAAFVNINSAAAPKEVNNFSVVIEQEEVLAIESWMLENELWAPKSAIEPMESEKPLEVETWMTNQEVFFKSEPSTALCADEKMGR